MSRVRVRDLVIKHTRKDEADAGTSGRSDESKDSLQASNRHGNKITGDDNTAGDDGEAEVGHDWCGSDLWWGEAEGGAGWTPFEDVVDGGSAGVALEWVGEHDEDDNCCSADCGRKGCGVHHDYIASNVGTEREVPCDGDEDVN